MALRFRLHRREALLRTLGNSYSGFHCLIVRRYEFAEKLVSDVDRCFDPPKKVRKWGSMLQVRREAMWSSYHKHPIRLLKTDCLHQFFAKPDFLSIRDGVCAKSQDQDTISYYRPLCKCPTRNFEL